MSKKSAVKKIEAETIDTKNVAVDTTEAQPEVQAESKPQTLKEQMEQLKKEVAEKKAQLKKEVEDLKAKAKEAKEKAKEAKEKDKSEKSFGRFEAFGTAILSFANGEFFDEESLAKTLDEAYCAHRGPEKSNLKESKAVANAGLKTLRSLGLISERKEEDKEYIRYIGTPKSE